MANKWTRHVQDHLTVVRLITIFKPEAAAFMIQGVRPDKSCPKCASTDYRFRGRKWIEAVGEKNQPPLTETKYQCATCGHQWKVRSAT
jgi:transposase-like protein